MGTHCATFLSLLIGSRIYTEPKNRREDSPNHSTPQTDIMMVFHLLITVLRRKCKCSF